MQGAGPGSLRSLTALLREGMAPGQPPPSRRAQLLSRGNFFIRVVEQEALGWPGWRRVPGLHQHQPRAGRFG